MAHEKSGIVLKLPTRFQFVGADPGTFVWRKGSGAGTLVCKRNRPSNSVLVDPWKIRDRFLAVESETSVLAFLNTTGDWNGSLNEEIPIQEFWDWQLILRRMLRGPAGYRELYVHLLEITSETRRSWGTVDEPKEQFVHVKRQVNRQTWDRVLGLYAKKFRFPDIDVRPLGIAQSQFIAARTDTTLDALLTSVHIDRIRRVKFGECARKDCRRIFKVTSKHRRKYCRLDCAHIESVRRGRRKRKRSQHLGRKMSAQN